MSKPVSDTADERAIRMRSLRPFARSRVAVILLAPFSVLLSAAHGAVLGAAEGCSSIRDAWSIVSGK